MALPTLIYAVTADGIEIPTYDQLLAYYQAVFLQVYGVDLTLQSSSSPDNQFISLVIQPALDASDLQVQGFNGFNPDEAFGNVLDMRCAINGIQRQAATYSVVNVQITITGSVPLYGLDQVAQSVYTIADSAGNQWQLVNTNLVATTNTYVFQAAIPGAVLAIPDSITIPVTIVLGVTDINNSTGQSTLGINEESDSALKIRRQMSVALPSQGYLSGLEAALLNVSGVNYARVYENNTGTSSTGTVPPGVPAGIPGHSIWVIVSGGAASGVANAIYTKRNAGCGMKGDQTFNVVQVDGSTFIVRWDNVVEQLLFIVFNASSLNGLTPPNIAAINSATTGLQAIYLPGVNAEVNINQLATLVQTLDPNVLVTSPGFSSGLVQTITFSGIAASGVFKLSFDGNSTSNINWNDNIGTIQSKLRLVSGLAAVTVAGSIAGQSLALTMTGVDPISLIGYNSNTLATSGPVDITLDFTTTYSNTLTPTIANNQFEVLAVNTIILPMIMAANGVSYEFTDGFVTGTTLSTTPDSTFTFTGLGGFGGVVYSISTGTGSTIDTSTGEYVAGTAGTDTVTCTDAMGNASSCVITIT